MLGRHLFGSTRLHRNPYRSLGTAAAVINGGSSSPNRTITPGSDQHHDLPSFLDYAARLNVSPTSSVYVGTYYEYTVASALRSLGFTLTRTGRSSDFGIDLLGHWQVPSLPAPLRVLVQCKAYKAVTPANVRELEGAFTGAPAGWKGEGVLGFLAATSQATKGMRDALIRSSVPMGFLQVTDEGKILQFVWNYQATQSGLEGMGVTTRFTPRMGEARSSNGVEQEITLTWNGWTISREPQQIDVVTVRPERYVKKSKVIAASTEKPEVKRRGRPRKLVQPEVEEKAASTSKASKTAASTTKPKTTSTAPKKLASKSRNAKPQKAVKSKAKGQRKKG